LQEHDAADVMQEVLLAIARAVPGFEYDRARGSFRGWLFTVVQNKLRNFYSSRQRRLQGTGSSGAHDRLQQLPAEEESSLWDREYEERMFLWACDQVRGKVSDHNWQAFHGTAIAGQDTHVVAEQLDMTVAAVRLAKSRVMAQIRKLIDELDAE
jgi:RNA polymerase sigma-70 factor (ECF subfamily)